jgi:hypothetical protein
MKVFIPMAEGQYIPHIVTRALAKQTLDIDIIPCCAPGIIQPNIKSSTLKPKKLQCECISRNLAIQFLDAMTDEYVGMQDRDIVQDKIDNYARAINFLHENRDYGAIALPWKVNDTSDHLRNASFVIRASILRQIKFRLDERSHICDTQRDDIRALGYKYQYLSGERLIREIEQ